MATPRPPPQFLIFSLKKAQNSPSWDKIEKHQPPVSQAEIQDQVRSFQRRATSVYSELEQISSSKCLAAIHQLVKDESAKLRTTNTILQYTIASLGITWQTTNHTSREPKTVVIALETEAIWQEPISAPSMGVSSLDASSTRAETDYTAHVGAQTEYYATPWHAAERLPYPALQQTLQALQPVDLENMRRPRPKCPLPPTNT